MVGNNLKTWYLYHLSQLGYSFVFDLQVSLIAIIEASQFKMQSKNRATGLISKESRGLSSLVEHVNALSPGQELYQKLIGDDLDRLGK